MIEMRWVGGHEPAPEVGDQYSRFVKRLQYRYNNQFQRAGGDWGDCWSEWIDVPTVTEGK